MHHHDDKQQLLIWPRIELGTIIIEVKFQANWMKTKGESVGRFFAKNWKLQKQSLGEVISSRPINTSKHICLSKQDWVRYRVLHNAGKCQAHGRDNNK